MDFATLAQSCAPNVHVETLSRIASVESSFNPFAIGVVGGRLQRQPKSLDEAVATARMLADNGYNYSLGIVQVNQKNFSKYGLTQETAFDPCTNLRVGGLILEDCYHRAGNRPSALTDAFSCYYSGNFRAGYKLGYVAKVQNALPISLTTVSKPNITPSVPALVVKARVQGLTNRLNRSSASLTISLMSDPVLITTSIKQIRDQASNAIVLPTTTQSGPSTALLF